MPIIPPFTAPLAWFKSSHSGGNATECVEAVFIPHGIVIRDSKRSESAQLTFSSEAWLRFLPTVQHGTGE
ncbi:DUF397 domain-containing protein [Streptomyces sp. NPDC093990]|uniref:DUF397 domain-containing protein n=1 Tax=Streptomyces sp. NPDC093990 TaxID=3155306 RepID=UPI00342AA2FC